MQETREKVRLLLQLADSLVERGHAHASAIKQWVASVDQSYKVFSERMDQYRQRLEQKLGLQSDVSYLSVYLICFNSFNLHYFMLYVNKMQFFF